MSSVASEAPKVSRTQERYLQLAQAGLWLRSPNMEVHVELGGANCRSIWGHSTTVIEIGAPGVIIFSEDSTPQKTKVHPEAYEEFQAAAERLARGGEKFYTILHPGWALPAMVWTLNRRY